MNDREERVTDDEREELAEEVGRCERRKLRARARKEQSIWFGLGMFGLVGWSVAIPTLIGLAIGIWIDRTFPGPRSWTLMFLVLGVAAGALNAWYWVTRERKMIERQEEEPDE